MKQDTVLIVVATYNGEKFLRFVMMVLQTRHWRLPKNIVKRINGFHCTGMRRIRGM